MRLSWSLSHAMVALQLARWSAVLATGPVGTVSSMLGSVLDPLMVSSWLGVPQRVPGGGVRAVPCGLARGGPRNVPQGVPDGVPIIPQGAAGRAAQRGPDRLLLDHRLVVAASIGEV